MPKGKAKGRCTKQTPWSSNAVWSVRGDDPLAVRRAQPQTATAAPRDPKRHALSLILGCRHVRLNHLYPWLGGLDDKLRGWPCLSLYI
jgi:hypothetical protein